MELTEELIVDCMSRLLLCDTRHVDDRYLFRLSTAESPELEIEIDSGTIANIIVTLKSYEQVDDITAVNSNSFEVLLQRPTLLAGRARVFDNGLTLTDSQNGLKYEIGQPSDAYIAFLLLKLHEHTGADERKWIWRLSRGYALNRLSSRVEDFTLLDFFRFLIAPIALRITSDATRSKTAFQQHAESLFFHLGYNLDLSLMPQRSVGELARPSRISTLRRSTLKELDAPRRHYLPDLVYHYQLGVAADSPMLEYISYYHVAEYWFENIYQDDLVDQIQRMMTFPGFSYRRKRDVSDLISKVTKAFHLRDERLAINEQVALRLTLERYLDTTLLVADLEGFDPTLVDYYARETVKFSGGDRVSLTSSDEAAKIAALSRRIYKTRNALVHSKDGAKSRFVPFANDGELLPEIPIMRFIAEQIITATSSMNS